MSFCGPTILPTILRCFPHSSSLETRSLEQPTLGVLLLAPCRHWSLFLPRLTSEPAKLNAAYTQMRQCPGSGRGEKALGPSPKDHDTRFPVALSHIDMANRDPKSGERGRTVAMVSRAAQDGVLDSRPRFLFHAGCSLFEAPPGRPRI